MSDDWLGPCGESKKRTSGAKAPLFSGIYGTAEAVPLRKPGIFESSDTAEGLMGSRICGADEPMSENPDMGHGVPLQPRSFGELCGMVEAVPPPKPGIFESSDTAEGPMGSRICGADEPMSEIRTWGTGCRYSLAVLESWVAWLKPCPSEGYQSVRVPSSLRATGR